MSPGSEALLAFDVGSTSTRVAAIGLDGSFLRTAARPTPIERPRSGWEQLDPGRVWDLLVELCAELELGEVRIRAVGVSALLSTAFFDAGGVSLAPALLWSDARGREAVEGAGGLLAATTLRIARRPLTGELLGPRLGWLAEHEPAAARCLARVGSLKDALIARLTGALSTDATHASYTGLFDVAAGQWSEKLIEAWGVDPAVLPEVRPATASAGGLADGAAQILGLPEGIAVAVGGPDGTVGALGAGAAQPAVAVDTAGTTDVIVRLVDDPLADPGGATVLNAFALDGLWGIGGPTGVTGGAVDWISRLLGYASVAAAFTALGDEVEAIGPGAGGVCFRTELSGERFPGWSTVAAGAIVSLRPEHGPAHLLRAAREGAAFAVAEGLEVLTAAGAGVEEMIVAGGLARDERALQMRADVCGVPVLASSNPEVTTLGAAMLAGLAGSAFASPAEAVAALAPPLRRIEPDPDSVRRYREARQLWRDAAPLRS